jgi:hypothetical protein
LKGALDAEYRCQLDSGTKTIAFESKKMKDAEMPAPKNFQITQVDLPIQDKHGVPVKGAYLTAVDISGLTSSIQKKTYLAGNQKKTLDCLVSIQINHQKNGIVDLVTYDEWRESAKEHGIKSNRFREVVDSLVKKSVVIEDSRGYRTRPDEGVVLDGLSEPKLTESVTESVKSVEPKL